MTTQTKINLDTSVLFNYLYSTILPNWADGKTEFEPDKGCRKYFDSESVLLVAGGKASGEFNAACDRRDLLYQDIIDFMEETGNGIVDYRLPSRDVYTSTNDETHYEDLRIAIIDQPTEGQLSTLRRCHQQLSACQTHILKTELHRTFNQFEHSGLLTAINNKLDIDDDADILVDAVIIARDYSVTLLASLDSDLNKEEHREKFVEIIEQEISTPIDLKIINPAKHTLN